MKSRDIALSAWMVFSAVGVVTGAPTAADCDQHGFARMAKRDWMGAIAKFDQALKLDPSDAQALAGRGNAQLERCEFDLAIADLNHAIQLDPKEETNYLNRGEAFLAIDKYDMAIADCDQALVLNPDDAQVLELRGDVKLKKTDFTGASTDLSRAFLLDRDNAKIVNQLFTAETNLAHDTYAASLVDGPEHDHVRQKIVPDDIAVGGVALIRIVIEDEQAARQGVSNSGGNGTVTSTASTFHFGATDNQIDIELPAVNGLLSKADTTSSATTSTNGIQTMTATRNFAVLALRSGDYVIPAFDVTSKAGQTYRVQAMTLHVHDVASSSSTAPTPIPPSAAPSPASAHSTGTD